MEGRREGWMGGWIDGGQGAVDARAVVVGRYFRTVRSATKDGQAAEEREAGRTDGRTSSSYRPGSVKGGGRIPNGGRRRTSPAPQPPLFLSPSLSLFPPPVRRHGRRRSRSLAGCRRPSAAATRARSEREGGRGGGGSRAEGNQDSRRDERSKVCSPRVHYLSLV